MVIRKIKGDLEKNVRKMAKNENENETIQKKTFKIINYSFRKRTTSIGGQIQLLQVIT